MTRDIPSLLNAMMEPYPESWLLANMARLIAILVSAVWKFKVAICYRVTGVSKSFLSLAINFAAEIFCIQVHKISNREDVQTKCKSPQKGHKEKDKGRTDILSRQRIRNDMWNTCTRTCTPHRQYGIGLKLEESKRVPAGNMRQIWPMLCAIKSCFYWLRKD